MNDVDTVTKKDLKDLQRKIVDEISGVIADALTTIGTNFTELKGENQGLQQGLDELKQDVQEIQNGQSRIEQKLDPTIDQVDDLRTRVTKLEQATA